MFSNNNSKLIRAIKKNDINKVKILIERGASKEACDKSGNSALDIASNVRSEIDEKIAYNRDNSSYRMTLEMELDKIIQIMFLLMD